MGQKLAFLQYLVKWTSLELGVGGSNQSMWKWKKTRERNGVWFRTRDFYLIFTTCRSKIVKIMSNYECFFWCALCTRDSSSLEVLTCTVTLTCSEFIQLDGRFSADQRLTTVGPDNCLPIILTMLWFLVCKSRIFGQLSGHNCVYQCQNQSNRKFGSSTKLARSRVKFLTIHSHFQDFSFVQFSTIIWVCASNAFTALWFLPDGRPFLRISARFFWPSYHNYVLDRKKYTPVCAKLLKHFDQADRWLWSGAKNNISVVRRG